jgi:hypothetical protein
MFLPESPRFWANKGDIEKATVALARVRDQPRDSDYVQDELAEIIANLEHEKAHIPQTSYVGSWLACFQGSLFDGSSNIRRTIVGTGPSFPVFSDPIFNLILVQVYSAPSNSPVSTSSSTSAPPSSRHSAQSPTPS